MGARAAWGGAHPAQPSVGGAPVVECLEGVNAAGHLRGQIEVVALVRGPEAGGEHLNGEVGVELDLFVAHVLGEGRLGGGGERGTQTRA